jgi:hypothetical protein
MPKSTVRRVNRFTVMAMLQAARARKLGLEEESAHSWGLNRAIFYAAAKRGFRGGKSGVPEGEHAGGEHGGERTSTGDATYYVGDDFAYRDPDSSKLYFTIGGETQTEEDFHRQIASRFGDAQHFREAWAEAEKIVGAYDEATLKSGREFYAEVYKPRRDQLVTEWGERYGPPGP